mmetsp:Transcript_1807/g.5899  ORF Transcript_1807/g.5899 Transcript_1807/m.5899 type:complete len:103 (+) Transcript_1807:1341-1649(+)
MACEQDARASTVAIVCVLIGDAGSSADARGPETLRDVGFFFRLAHAAGEEEAWARRKAHSMARGIARPRSVSMLYQNVLVRLGAAGFAACDRQTRVNVSRTH